jgi:hypothetical protein
MSCDYYRDTWAMFHRFWKNIAVPIPLLLVSNYLPSPTIPTLTIGEDGGWCKNAQTVLEKYIREEYFVLSFDDHWITKFDTAKFAAAAESLEKNPLIGCIYLWHRHTIKGRSVYNELLDLIDRDVSDRIMLGPCLIRREFMLSILREVNKMERQGEPWRGASAFGNPYDYELLGYPIAKDMPWETLIINRDENEIMSCAPHPVKEGYWHMPSVREIERLFGVKIELGTRPLWDDNNPHPPMFKQ